MFVEISRLSVLIESDKQDLFVIETEETSIQHRVDDGKHCFSYNCNTLFLHLPDRARAADINELILDWTRVHSNEGQVKSQ